MGQIWFMPTTLAAHTKGLNTPSAKFRPLAGNMNREQMCLHSRNKMIERWILPGEVRKAALQRGQGSWVLKMGGKFQAQGAASPKPRLRLRVRTRSCWHIYQGCFEQHTSLNVLHI